MTVPTSSAQLDQALAAARRWADANDTLSVLWACYQVVSDRLRKVDERRRRGRLAPFQLTELARPRRADPRAAGRGSRHRVPLFGRGARSHHDRCPYRGGGDGHPDIGDLGPPPSPPRPAGRHPHRGDPPVALQGAPLTEAGVLEQACRSLARLAATEEERVALIDHANRYRPWSLA